MFNSKNFQLYMWIKSTFCISLYILSLYTFFKHGFNNIVIYVLLHYCWDICLIFSTDSLTFWWAKRLFEFFIICFPSFLLHTDIIWPKKFTFVLNLQMWNTLVTVLYVYYNIQLLLKDVFLLFYIGIKCF